MMGKILDGFIEIDTEFCGTYIFSNFLTNYRLITDELNFLRKFLS